MQVWPAATKPPKATPLTASDRSASSNTITGVFPPSSAVILAKRRAAASLTARPPSSPPVKLTWATSGWLALAWPVGRPGPVTTLTTPSGIPASRASRPRRMVVSGVSSEGLITTVLPAASAPDRLWARISIGWLNGVSRPHTPSGTRWMKDT